MTRLSEKSIKDIMDEAPQAEPERQYYFIEECNKLLSSLSENKGKEPSYFVNTFGCQMNAKDSEKLCGILELIGYKKGTSEASDFVLYNTCTVREHANLRVYGKLGVLKGEKRKNPDMIIALCGCMMQEKEVVEKIKNSYPYVNIIFGTYNIYKLAELLFLCLATGKTQTELLDKPENIVEDLPEKRKYFFKAGVNIMYGCDNFCTYCIVPYVRGRERSRKPEDILSQINKLANDGVIEVMLLGQNVNSYEYDFPALLKETCKIKGIQRVRFMTSHPKDLSDELIKTIAAEDKICKHVHLPLQSGSSDILKKMNRKYDKQAFLKLAGKIRSNIPGVSITTDIIVGFPGETDADFEETLDVVKKVKFDSAFTFKYSKRTGTAAAGYKDQVPKDVVDKRFESLLSLCTEISAEATQKYKGSVMKVLCEEVNPKDSSLISGRLSNNSVVHFKGSKELIGKITDVRLVEAKGFYYFGESVCPSPR